MTPRSISLRGLSLIEAEAAIRKFIDDVQQESLMDFEIVLIDHGADRDDIDREIARHRAELVEWREQAIAKMRGMAERDGQSLN